MSDIPIGVKFSSSGEAKVLQSLKSIEKGTGKIKASTVALGTLSAGAIFRGFEKLARFVNGSITDAAALAQKAREGGEVAAQYSDAGLAAAESIKKQFDSAVDSAKAKFVNLLPTIQFVVKYLWNELQYWAKGIGGSVYNFFTSIPDSLGTLRDNFGVFFSWLGDNWRKLAYNFAEFHATAFLNTMENIKRIVVAAKDWVSGKGWSLDLLGLGEGGNYESIKGPEFKTFAFQEKNAALWERLGEERAAELAKITGEMNSLETATVRGAGASKKESAPQLAEALVKGSTAAYSAVNKARMGEQSQALAIQRRELEQSIKTNQLLADLKASFDLQPISI